MADQIEVPIIPDSFINSQQGKGKDLLKQQNSGAPRFSYPDISGSQSTRNILLNALLGIGSGTRAAESVNNLGSAPTSFMAGLSGAISGPTIQDIESARSKARAEAQLAHLETIPLDENNFPGLIAKHPELKGLPLGLVNKISGIISNNDRLEQALQMFAAKFPEEVRHHKAVENKQPPKKLIEKILSGEFDNKGSNITGKIRVKVNGGGTGTIDAKDFDANTMTRL